jgi:hypothetical protein
VFRLYLDNTLFARLIKLSSTQNIYLPINLDRAQCLATLDQCSQKYTHTHANLQVTCEYTYKCRVSRKKKFVFTRLNGAHLHLPGGLWLTLQYHLQLEVTPGKLLT